MLKTRTEKLEATHQPQTVTCVIRRMFSPGSDGPVDRGLGRISVIGGETFTRRAYATEASLLAAANACHERVHGCPLPTEAEQ